VDIDPEEFVRKRMRKKVLANAVISQEEGSKK
jgi:hypothetical protein